VTSSILRDRLDLYCLILCGHLAHSRRSAVGGFTDNFDELMMALFLKAAFLLPNHKITNLLGYHPFLLESERDRRMLQQHNRPCDYLLVSRKMAERMAIGKRDSRSLPLSPWVDTTH